MRVMRGYIYPTSPQFEPSQRCLESMMDGFPRIGIKVELGDYDQRIPDDADFVVTFGWIKKHLDGFSGWRWPRNKIIRQARDRGIPVLCVERGCIDQLGRDNWHHLGWNGLNGRSTWLPGNPGNSPGNRWDEVFAPHVEVREFERRPDGPVVLLGQVPRDASIDSCPNYQGWLDEVGNLLVKGGRSDIDFFRPHLKAQGVTAGKLRVNTDGTLEDVLRVASRTIAWNSTSGVSSVLAGVPHVAHDEGSMTWHLGGPVSVDSFGDRDRQQWLQELAYSQWNDDEIRSGDALRHMVSVMWEVLV